ncbi:MAG TPA: fibronectin type III domain-containing protein, partial [Chloroflexaceae bacterium]|nr:fibronectin type III domain-containing protein [Chloroflexaceae bacterium]
MTTRPYLRRIDQPAPVTGGGNELLSAQGEQLGAPVVTVAHPTGLTITGTGVLFEGVTPTSYANLSWTPGNGTPPRATYQVQQATNSAFTTGLRTDPTSRTDASVNGEPGRAYWYRVRALLDGAPSAWSNVVTTTLPVDVAPPDPPTATSASFAVDGTLEVRATPPASKNFKHVRVEVYNAGNTALLDSSQFAGGVWTWSPTRNRQQTAAAGLGTVSTQVTVRLAAISHGNVASTTVTIAVASPAPATPAGLSHSWAGDTGTAGADLLITHTVVAGLSYHLSIDGLERQIVPGRYPYPFGQNAAEHGGGGEPLLTLSLGAENGLGQRSATPATATGTKDA